MRAAGEDGGVGADYGGAGAESRNTDISEKVEGPEELLHRPEEDSEDQFKPVLPEPPNDSQNEQTVHRARALRLLVALPWRVPSGEDRVAPPPDEHHEAVAGLHPQARGPALPRHRSLDQVTPIFKEEKAKRKANALARKCS